MSSRFSASRTIYVGNLPGDVRERDVEDIFYKYGRIVDIDLKIPPRPPGYAFVEFEDPQDAEDAIRGRDGYDFDGYRLRVEFAHGGRSAAPALGGGYRSGPPRTGGISRRTEYRVIVKNLPSSASWQDLKDHMRKAGDVCFAQVFKDGGGMMGIVDYTNEDDMKYALRKLDDSDFKDRHGTGAYIRLRKLDDSEFRNRYSRGAYIRVYPEKDDRGRDRSDSRSPDRGRDRGRDRSYSRSPSPRRRRDDDDDEGDGRGKDRKDDKDVKEDEDKVRDDRDKDRDEDYRKGDGKEKEDDDREDDRRKDEDDD